MQLCLSHNFLYTFFCSSRHQFIISLQVSNHFLEDLFVSSNAFDELILVFGGLQPHIHFHYLNHDIWVREMSPGIFAVETFVVWVPFCCAIYVEDFFPV